MHGTYIDIIDVDPKSHVKMSRIFIGSSVSLMVKGDFHIGLCVKPLDGKVGQTTMLD
jgi:hypothetical protein